MLSTISARQPLVMPVVSSAILSSIEFVLQKHLTHARLSAKDGRAAMPAGKVRKRGGNLHHAVAEDIGARILKGEFAPGTLLPNEAEWCQAYKVSRTAVREAIRMLAAKGLVASRPKIGSRVEPRERWNLLDRDVLGWYGAAMDAEKFLQSI